MFRIINLTFIVILLTITRANSLIEIDITRGNLDPLPIAVSPLFQDDNSKNNSINEIKIENVGSEISLVVENNLKTSGLFNPLSKDAFLQSVNRDQNVGKIAIAYTVWSKKKGGGKLIVKQVYKMIKKSNHLNRLVTLSPLTDMARKFHLSNGAVEVGVNEYSQNFEYKM